MLICSNPISGQHGGDYLYGIITTKSGDQYRGYMRWGGEEVSWTDIFNSTKTSRQLKEGQSSKGFSWKNMDWDFNSIWRDNRRSSSRSFACQFGDIAFLHNRGKDRVDIELKNGAIIQVDGGSNDIGARIELADYELGTIKMEWKRVENVEFFQAPEEEEPEFGDLLYGKVQSRRGGSFEGFIKWDNDERVAYDILDGDSRNGEQKIPFGNIKSITKDEDGSIVDFPSGRSLFLDGSNDVSNGNRGVIVYVDQLGSVEIPWRYFESVTFTPTNFNKSYENYPNPQILQGEVRMFNGTIHEGQIIFDMDEFWDMEMLDGNDDYVEYQIPFRNIGKIIPKNRSYSLVVLRNGQEILLGDTQDVSSNNDGVLILGQGSSKPVNVDWDDIDEIVFN